MGSQTDDYWICYKNVSNKEFQCIKLSDTDKSKIELEYYLNKALPVFMTISDEKMMVRIILIGSEEEVKSHKDSITSAKDKAASELKDFMAKTLENQDKLMEAMMALTQNQKEQENEIKAIRLELQSLHRSPKSPSFPLNSPGPNTGASGNSQPDSDESEKTQLSSKSYIPEGYIKAPAASGRHELKHIVPVKRFIPNSTSQIRLTGDEVLAAARRNPEWLKTVENLKISGISEASMCLVRNLLVDGPTSVRKLSRALASSIYGDKILATFLMGYDGKSGRNIRFDPLKTGPERQTLPIDEEMKMRKIYSIVDEIFERQAIWRELVADPINQKGRDDKKKSKLKVLVASTSDNVTDNVNESQQ